MPRAPGRRRRGSGPCRGRPGASGVRPRARNARTSSSRTSARMSSSSSTAILLISCEVRKPSKKWRNGIRARSVAACATSAKSCASWTEPAASIAQPVVRACMTSLWSPKIDRACVATVRAATWMTAGVSSPAILNMLGIISSRPCDAVNVVAEGALLERAVERAGGARLGLHLDDVGDLAPQVRPARGRPVVAMLGHRGGRGDRVDRDHLAERRRRCGRPPRCRRGTRSAGPRAGPPFGVRVGAPFVTGSARFDGQSRADIIRPAPARRSRTTVGSPTFSTPSRRLLKRS